ncbi:hypothetical protein GH714_010051 [Hevea brasiliensis]|uniref:C2 domain-containing protein n=2 Tax=Hevea brasiliensis TaxID=3981 RepID=A0A6A6MJV3_HEVBR|nr:hypothetical protein GH714_010044 [Hevea brasiliensis]KAF2313259.1 hypothetical protein GH714_010051 [Hevea brasiliensis]
MPLGTVEVLLVGAKGLENTDFLNGVDPYVVLACRTQEQKSSVASGKGSEPEWNEKFSFEVSDGDTELTLKIMDSDVGAADDFVGEATIPLEPLFLEGNLPSTAYKVVKEQEYKGEITVGLTFTPEVEMDNVGVDGYDFRSSPSHAVPYSPSSVAVVENQRYCNLVSSHFLTARRKDYSRVLVSGKQVASPEHQSELIYQFEKSWVSQNQEVPNYHPSGSEKRQLVAESNFPSGFEKCQLVAGSNPPSGFEILQTF